MLPLQGVWFNPELGNKDSHTPHGTAKKKKKVTLEGTKYLLAVFDNPHGVNVASQNAVEKRC